MSRYVGHWSLKMNNCDKPVLVICQRTQVLLNPRIFNQILEAYRISETCHLVMTLLP